jgi:hypothetical protein
MLKRVVVLLVWDNFRFFTKIFFLPNIISLDSLNLKAKMNLFIVVYIFFKQYLVELF